MDAPDKRFSDLVDVVKSWIPRRTVSETVSRDFWMPDQSCRVCYECDSQFTIFNRRHHCRLCGRVFCAKCTANSIPAPSDEPKTIQEEWERIRVCNYCFKHWERRIATIDNENRVFSSGLSPSPSSTSLASTKSSATRHSNDSTIYSIPNSTGPYQHLSCGSSPSPLQSKQTESGKDKQDVVASVTARNVDIVIGAGDPSPDQFGSFKNRSDDDDDEYGMYQSDSEARNLFHANDYYGAFDFDDMDNAYGSPKFQPDEQNIVTRGLSSSPLCKSLNSRDLEGIKKLVEESDGNDTDLFEPSSTLYEVEGSDAEPVDFENNRLLWLPPEPEDFIFDDDDDNDQGDTGEWGHLRSSSSLGSGDYCNRDRSCEDHNKAMKNVVDGHFRALVAQLLQVENLPVGEEDEKEGWLEIVTSLSWEAASLLKPDTSKSGGMDPGGYVKVKCLACGRRSESMVVKGIVFKKNVAHRRMTSKIAKPQLLILGGALEYQRVSNLLSSFDTLLQQEMDHLKMAVAKIDAQHPNVLLVEKSVSRFAQEYLLAKDISLVLNIKRPLLERIARSTGAHIVPSIDNLSSQKLGHCDLFHVEKFFEEHGTAGQFGKKSMKTLMFFDGCPKPLGFTILLKGANGDELKKLKHVVQYGVFAAYHLALETSFLADEGASLPEIPLKSPITVTLPDKLASIDRSISIIPGFTVPDTGKPQQPQTNRTPRGSNTCRISDRTKLVSNSSSSKIDMALSPCLFNGPGPQFTVYTSFASFSTLSSSSQSAWGPCDSKLFPHNASEEKTEVDFKELKSKASDAYNDQTVMADNLVANSFGPSEALGKGVLVNTAHADLNPMVANHLGTSEFVPMQDSRKYHEELESTKEEFPPSPSDHQSILFSSSTRCVWKGTVCERAHLFRIKYYGTFDKPLGRFLRDHLFDQSYRCNSCEMPSEAHVHCYIHRQGSLTISVTKLPEFLLAGEREGKIWMWHRCLRCPRTNGFPPATRRVLMSDAAWGLSFGKFLELSFSNHAAASRVATCGHSLHRDCLRFYGFGRMIACFRYASIDVHSVYLPPPKLDFSYEIPECVQKEMNEVVYRAKVLFTEVLNALHKISEKRSGNGSLNSRMKELESKFFVAKLEGVLQNEKLEFEESLQKALTRELKKGQPTVDVLEINRLQRQLLFQSYMWDQCLIYAADSGNNTCQEGLNRCIPKVKEKPLSSMEKIVETDVNSKPGRGFSSCDSVLVDAKQYESINQQVYSSDLHGLILKEQDTDEDLTCGKERQDYLSSGKNLGDHVNHQESEVIRRALCDGQFPIIANLSDTLDAAWTGENHPGSITPKENGLASPASALSGSSTMVGTVQVRSHLEDNVDELSVAGIAQSLAHVFPTKKPAIIEDSVSWGGMPLLNLYHSLNKNSSGSVEKLDFPGEYSPVYVLSLRDLERQSGARLRLPVGFDKTVVLVYDDEPTSIISYALVSPDYHVQISEERDKPKYGGESSASLQLSDSMNLQSVHSFDETASESVKSLGSTDENILSISGSQSSLVLDPLLYTKALHVRVSFADDGPLGKVKYSVTCYYAKRFEALRKICCPSELDFIRSLCRCKKWGAQGGKSNVFFAKTLDDRFIVKQVTKTELEAFIKFAPAYFKYLSESIGTGSPTCLAKILGIYQVTSKHLKGGKESKMDVLVMENLLFRRNVTRLYDLKGSSRSRYNPDSSGNNKVLLDQNLIEAMPTSPIFVGNKAKRLLERAVWNDTSFLASIDVMDYSLLVGVDEEKHELVLGIIDFMRQYTWDKHLETWVKASGILGGPKNSSPTVISPKQYKKRFRKAMSTYFLMVPDQWFHPNIIPSGTQSDLCEENPQGGASLE